MTHDHKPSPAVLPGAADQQVKKLDRRGAFFPCGGGGGGGGDKGAAGELGGSGRGCSEAGGYALPDRAQAAPRMSRALTCLPRRSVFCAFVFVLLVVGSMRLCQFRI